MFAKRLKIIFMTTKKVHSLAVGYYFTRCHFVRAKANILAIVHYFSLYRDFF